MEELIYTIGSLEAFDWAMARVIDKKTGEKLHFALSDRKQTDLLAAAKQSASPWFFAHTADMVLIMCGPAELLEE